jgi:hypothetical protein
LYAEESIAIYLPSDTVVIDMPVPALYGLKPYKAVSNAVEVINEDLFVL